MAFLVLLIPLLVMVFALLMERLEHRLQSTTMSGQDVEEFFDTAQPDEVNTFIREGWSRAMSTFRRRRTDPSPTRSRLFPSSRPSDRRGGS
jgi:hypothetical protein